MVATPAISNGSLPDVCTYNLLHALVIHNIGVRRRMLRHEKNLGPIPFMETTLPLLAPTGTTIKAFAPNNLAAYATDCPWFPVDAAITPCCLSAALSWEIRLMPPRTLNEPIGW